MNLSKGLAVVVAASAAAFGLCPNAAADPAAPQPTPQPIATQQLPGLPALSQLSPIIQQAASDPQQATQLLMAAAQAKRLSTDALVREALDRILAEAPAGWAAAVVAG